jgi:sodium-coupled monocarboxylate transporter 8/12
LETLPLAKLSTFDLAVFISYMLLLVGVGLYFTRQKKNLKSYLLADQNIHWIIVAVSVLAALFSGITYLGAPAQTYANDLSYLWVIASFFIATPITTLVFLPFFRSLNLYTAYEYLHRRFDHRLQVTASALFITRICFHLGLAVYAPALAIVAITGWPLWLCITLTGLAATLYTTLGGMKAVIWTDTLQFIILCGGIVLVLGYAIAAIPGGVSAAWQIAQENGRTRFIDLSLDPAIPMTVWAALLGGASINLIQMATDQISVQRYLTAPTLKDSQRALWFKLWVTMPLLLVFCLTGTTLFAYYEAVPGRQPELAAKDQILPYFVVNHLPSPLPGLLIAAIFGATMAVASAGINSLATTALMDFRRYPQAADASERRQVRSARLLTLLFGVVVTLLALALGQVNQTLVNSIFMIQGIFGGPLLGTFFLGALSRRANAWGALVGIGGGFGAGILVALSRPLFGVVIAPLWIAFSGAAVACGAGLLASLFVRAPSAAQQELVYRPGRTAPQPAVEPVPTSFQAPA